MKHLAILLVAACGAPSTPPMPAARTEPRPPASLPAPLVPGDADADRVTDANDRCPYEPENHNEVEDDDGCPDRCKVYPSAGGDCFLTEFFTFERGSAVVDETARWFEQTVAAMNASRGDVEVVTVRGYRSKDEPLRLSRERATNVVSRLVARGIDAQRFQVVDGGVPRHGKPWSHRRIDLEITKQRIEWGTHDDVVCTAMGRWHIQITPEQRRAGGFCPK